MTRLVFKENMKKAVEAASGGTQTILRTANDQPFYANVVKKFDLSTIDAALSGTHPAFIVNGVEVDKIYIGTYQSTIVNGEALSLPNNVISTAVALEGALTASRACGAGFHLMTAAEWSVFALRAVANSIYPYGNSGYGREARDSTQFGVREDGLDPGVVNATGGARILSGTGPASFRSRKEYNGVCDLVGNVSEWTWGIRFVPSGTSLEVQVLENNNAISYTTIAAAEAQWKAIDATNGSLIAPNGTGSTANSVKFATSGVADYTLVLATNSPVSSISNPSTTAQVSAAAIATLKKYGIYNKDASAPLAGYMTIAQSTALTGNRYNLRGGNYSFGAAAGIYTLTNQLATQADGFVGFRTCYIPQ